jgi:hypothetical protein
MNHRLIFCFSVTVLILAIVGLVRTRNYREPAQWQKLAELTNSAGQYFVVGQKSQLLEGAGWRVFFSFVDSDKKLYGSLLEDETFPPWKKVRLIQTNDTVEIWRGKQLAGTLDLSHRVFLNSNGASEKYVEGVDGQGTRKTNFVLDVQ